MARSQETFPRLNLAQHHASLVSFYYVGDWTDELASALSDLPFNSDNTFISVTPYRRRGSGSHVFQEFAEKLTSEHGERARIYVSYSKPDDAPKSVPKSLQRGGQLLARLAEYGQPMLLGCHIDFDYPGDNEITIYPLPFPVPRGLPFDEIRGIRGVKRAGAESDELAYSFTLDKPGDGIYLHLYFSLTSVVGTDTPREVLDFGSAIARELVIPKGSKREPPHG